MFSALQQGSQIYILDKKNTPKLSVGQVVSTTTPTYNTFGTNSFLDSKIDINVKVGDDIIEFKQINSNLSTISDPITGTTITETRELMVSEVENMLQSSKSVINSIPYHEEVIKSGESMLKQLNPRYAKEQERDEDILNLKNKVGGMETKLDKIFDLLTKPETIKT